MCNLNYGRSDFRPWKPKQLAAEDWCWQLSSNFPSRESKLKNLGCGWHTWTPVESLIEPPVDMPWTALSTCPRSSVGVTRTLGTLPARLRTPTLFSGFDCVLAPARRLTASPSAWRKTSEHRTEKIAKERNLQPWRKVVRVANMVAVVDAEHGGLEHHFLLWLRDKNKPRRTGLFCTGLLFDRRLDSSFRTLATQ